MNKNFNNERKLFLSFIEKLKKNTEIQNELNLAIKILFQNYDSKNNENKFVQGGAFEIFISLCMLALGFKISWIAGTQHKSDILLNNHEISIKSSADNIINSFRIINIHGKAKTIRIWDKATIFIICGYGIGYCDNKFINEKYLSIKTDGIDIKTKLLKEFWLKNPKYLFKFNLVTKKSARTEKTNDLRVSYEISKNIINDNCKILKKYLNKLTIR